MNFEQTHVTNRTQSPDYPALGRNGRLALGPRLGGRGSGDGQSGLGPWKKGHLDTHLSAEEVLGQLWARPFSLSRLVYLVGAGSVVAAAHVWKSEVNLVKMAISFCPVGSTVIRPGRKVTPPTEPPDGLLS